MLPPLPESWQRVVGDQRDKPYFQALEQFLDEERARGPVYPDQADVFAALAHTPYERVRVLLLGQDPYPSPGHAHGLAFSVRPGVKPPASLCNIYKELGADVGCDVPLRNGSLLPWAEQGVLLLNTVLTVRGGEALSHRGRGWEAFTDAVFRTVNERAEPLVFVLWGGEARKKAPLVDTTRHAVVAAAHPSPLSARGGFFGSRPFSEVNAELRRLGRPEIDWTIRDDAPVAAGR